MLDPAAPVFNHDDEIAVFVKDTPYSKAVTLQSTFGVMRDELIGKIEVEEKKYALTEREKILVDTIYTLLDTLDKYTIRKATGGMD